MPRVKKPPKVKQWSVPMTMHFRGSGTVEAVSADEARQKADAGYFEMHPGSGLYDWEVTGEPERKD